MTKLIAAPLIVVGIILIPGVVWLRKNANEFFSWSPSDWEHDDRDERVLPKSK